MKVFHEEPPKKKSCKCPRITATGYFKCYSHPGSENCTQLKLSVSGLSLERHTNGKFTWFEVCDHEKGDCHRHDKKKEAIEHYNDLLNRRRIGGEW